ncbi:pseudouridylate synthase RPUSD4, mitochondrial [Neosynchiropus ocellatus]
MKGCTPESNSPHTPTMSSCRLVCSLRLSAELNTLFQWVKTQTNCGRCSPFCRTHATAPEQNPDAGSEDKPRLRAIDLARKIQQEKQKKSEEAEVQISSQQKRVIELKQFSQKLQKVHPNVLAKHLTRAVLYQDKDVVITNKPYGVPLRGDAGLTSVASVLPVVARMMEGTKVRTDAQLLPSLALEKEATGALLLARSEGVVEHLLDLCRNNRLQRKFWVITVGVPVPAEGMIDIPLIEREVAGAKPHFKMALSPLYRMNEDGDGVTKVRGNRQAIPAITRYSVLESANGCSLVELQPLTGVKHQLRVHMAFGLSCPILGDHKYSHWSKLAPQKLPERVLGNLGLEQSKIRHLPLHLHSKLLAIPRKDESEIKVSCPPPKFFKQTMSRLHLMFPNEKKD